MPSSSAILLPPLLLLLNIRYCNQLTKDPATALQIASSQPAVVSLFFAVVRPASLLEYLFTHGSVERSYGTVYLRVNARKCRLSVCRPRQYSMNRTGGTCGPSKRKSKKWSVNSDLIFDWLGFTVIILPVQCMQ